MPHQSTSKSSTKQKELSTLVQRYRLVSHRRHTRCRICARHLPEPVIFLPDFPMTEIYVRSKQSQKLAVLDQGFCFCPNCGHGQLINAIAAEVLYGQEYFTRTSGTSATTAIDDFLKFIIPQLPSRKIKGILEIGCNDLYSLNHLSDRADALCGIDPIWRNRPAPNTNPKIQVIGDFFENVDLSKLSMISDVVLCSHTLEHIDDPVLLLRSLVATASDKTLFFFQFPGLEPLVRDGRFDQLHHQHLNYFTLQSVVAALNYAGAELLNYEYNYNHWGALMISFRKGSSHSPKTNRRFLRRYQRVTSQEVRNRYGLFKKSNQAIDAALAAMLKDRKVYGFGAALMLPILAYHLPHIRKLTCIIDDDPNKHGLYYINLPIQIVPLEKVNVLSHATVAITAINSKQNIRAIAQRLIQIHVRDIFVPSHVL